MNKDLDLKNNSISKLFLNYLIPSITGMLIMSLQIVIDGIFVGRGVGSDGLAGVNIVVPFFGLFIAIGLLIGLGGSTIVSIYLGQGKVNEARKIFTQSVLVAILIIVPIALISLLNIKEVSYMLGANNEIYSHVYDYLSVTLVFSIIHVLNSALNCFVRNDGAPMFSMIGMVIGAVINCILDYVFIFIFHWGVKGAALATGIGCLISMLIFLIHFILKRKNLQFVKTNFNMNDLSRIFKNGFPSFFAEMSYAIVMLEFNWAFMRSYGELGVSAYSIVNYIHALMLMVFMGIAQAVQPIISYNFGIGEEERYKQGLKLAVNASLIFGMLFFAAGLLFGKHFVLLFVRDNKELIDITTSGIRLYYISYIFMGINIVIAMFFQAIESSGVSTLLSVSRGLAFISLFVVILPIFMGVDGIWLATPFAEMITLIFSLYFIKQSGNKLSIEGGFMKSVSNS